MSRRRTPSHVLGIQSSAPVCPFIRSEKHLARRKIQTSLGFGHKGSTGIMDDLDIDPSPAELRFRHICRVSVELWHYPLHSLNQLIEKLGAIRRKWDAYNFTFRGCVCVA